MNEDPELFLGNLLLLIVGGNDTTRNSISGGVIGLNKYPEEYQKLRDNPDCAPQEIDAKKNVDGHKYQAEIEFLSKEVCASAWVLA